MAAAGETPLLGGATVEAVEEPDEVAGVIVTDGLRDTLDAGIRLEEQPPGLGHPAFDDPLEDGAAGLPAHELGEVGWGASDRLGHVREPDGEPESPIDEPEDAYEDGTALGRDGAPQGTDHPDHVDEQELQERMGGRIRSHGLAAKLVLEAGQTGQPAQPLLERHRAAMARGTPLGIEKRGQEQIVGDE